MVPGRGIVAQGGICQFAVGDGGALVDTDVAMEGNGQVRDAYGLDDSGNYGTVYPITGGVLAMGFARDDVEICEMACAITVREGEAREQGPSRRGFPIVGANGIEIRAHVCGRGGTARRFNVVDDVNVLVPT